jgi:molybdate transport system substrate-binding protein
MAQAGRREVVVFAAASLEEAFVQIGAEFASARPGVTVTFNFAGSQQLAQQLASGAPADVFASANAAQMQIAMEARRVDPGTVQPFASNRLAVVLPADNPGDVASLADLARPGLKLVLADAAVPAGAYSLDFLAKASAQPSFTATYSATVLANVVSYEENVRAVLSKVALGEADAGIVYASDLSGREQEQLQRIAIPDELNQVATYPVAPVVDAPQAELAADFVRFVLSDQGQRVLEDQGFVRARQN